MDTQHSQTPEKRPHPTVIDVARYILDRIGPMTTMKLEKLVYYCQAWSLAWDGVPLFDEDFQAWANGPACPELFDTHRGRFQLEPGYYDYVPPHTFSEDQIETMDAVIRDYGSKDPQWLSELTHLERPWKETRGDIRPGDRCNKVIPKDLMQDYYVGL